MKMKRKDNFLAAVGRSAILGGVLFVILPLLDRDWTREDARHAALGIAVGAIVGAVLWPIGQRFRKKEKEAIEQMHAETTSKSAPSAASEASDA